MTRTPDDRRQHIDAAEIGLDLRNGRSRGRGIRHVCHHCRRLAAERAHFGDDASDPLTVDIADRDIAPGFRQCQASRLAHVR
ncbi:MAG: hypothetical protein M0R03_10500 [Novosphingobium sp.]|nr:hypothetical protein [Novosphingobium sp.]